MKLALCVLAGAMGANTLPAPSNPLPAAPAEVTAAAPPQTVLLAYTASGSQEGATAIAVYETPPDADDIRHRVLTIFGNRNGRFVPEVTSDKLIACSKCTQFHDDPFHPKHVEVSAGHVQIDQFDSGQMPSTTSFTFQKRQGKWLVTEATRETYEAGVGKPRLEKMPIATSGLVEDMDGRWTAPAYFNALVVDDITGMFAFLHGEPTIKQLHERIARDCNASSCRVLAQQKDGCISLIRDSSGRSFGASNADPEAKLDAINNAMATCKATGGSGCAEVRTDCDKGIW